MIFTCVYHSWQFTWSIMEYQSESIVVTSWSHDSRGSRDSLARLWRTTSSRGVNGRTSSFASGTAGARLMCTNKTCDVSFQVQDLTKSSTIIAWEPDTIVRNNNKDNNILYTYIYIIICIRVYYIIYIHISYYTMSNCSVRRTWPSGPRKPLWLITFKKSLAILI